MARQFLANIIDYINRHIKMFLDTHSLRQWEKLFRRHHPPLSFPPCFSFFLPPLLYRYFPTCNKHKTKGAAVAKECPDPEFTSRNLPLLVVTLEVPVPAQPQALRIQFGTILWESAFNCLNFPAECSNEVSHVMTERPCRMSNPERASVNTGCCYWQYNHQIIRDQEYWDGCKSVSPMLLTEVGT